jgi:hypothetical protein
VNLASSGDGLACAINGRRGDREEEKSVAETGLSKDEKHFGAGVTNR